jgi:type VI secretion system protein
VVQFRDGAYYLTDTSTNGVTLEHSGLRLRRGNSERLQDGELIRLGNYEIQARIEAPEFSAGNARDLAFGNPSGYSAPASGAAFTDFDALLGGGSAPSADPFAGISSGAQAHFQGGSPLDTKPDLFDFLGTPTTPTLPPRADHIPAEMHAFTPPVAQQPAVTPTSAPPVSGAPVGGIPADWDPFADIQPPAARETHAEPRAFDLPAQPGNPVEPPSSPLPLDFDLDAVTSLDGTPLGGVPSSEKLPPAQPLAGAQSGAGVPPNDPFAAIGLAPPAAERMQAPAQVSAAAQPAQAPVAPPSRSSEASPSASTGHAEPELLQAFLRGAGLERLQIQPADRVAQMEAIGRSYRLMVEGLVDVLRARASLKGEFRMSQTMIRPVENNPLKFAPNVEEALLLLLRQGNQAFMPPDQAVSESFEDLKAHQIAVMAGIQAAIRHLLARFEPRALEARLDKPGGLAALLPGARQAKYWELFTQLYASISWEAEDDFQDLFGREFSRAYEEQIARLQRS